MDCEFAVVESAEALALRAAGMIAAEIRRKPELVIIPATGNTPLATYRELGRMREVGELDASRVRVFQLDDYVGIGVGDLRSLYAWMQRAFLEPLGISEERVTSIGGPKLGTAAACTAYDRELARAGGADLVILGLGPNGHLGYNEPPSLPDAPTRVVELTAASLASSRAYFADAPRLGVTAGMKAILSAKKIVMLVSGRSKREILRRALGGPVGPELPASYLQLCPQAVVIADREAAGE
jgi:glucosamine-6-phosphate deaminase